MSMTDTVVELTAYLTRTPARFVVALSIQWESRDRHALRFFSASLPKYWRVLFPGTNGTEKFWVKWWLETLTTWLLFPPTFSACLSRSSYLVLINFVISDGPQVLPCREGTRPSLFLDLRPTLVFIGRQALISSLPLMPDWPTGTHHLF